ncbi:MAG: ABC transporter ATP-binding protein [Actinomycetales bacterium]|nr:ABC transporter ATP-binding protein [Actinomycetales bacterium]
MTVDVEVRQLRLSYGRTVALDDLSLSLPGGRVYGLLGRNGAGKTSLLSVLAGFRRASAGEVLVSGEPVFENSRITRQVCLIRESGDVGDGDDRVKETLDIARHLRPSWDAEYARRLVDRFGVPLDRKVKDLSRGQRSALGIVVGLASRTPLLMFDEAHLGLDAPSREAFQEELIAEVGASPRTVVVSTHLIEEQAPLFEEVLILDRGRLVVQEETDTLLARGTTVTGHAAAVETFTAGMTTLGERRLGRTVEVTVFGDLDDADRVRAGQAGLDLTPMALQDLFIHLTDPDVHRTDPDGGPR